MELFHDLTDPTTELSIHCCPWSRIEDTGLDLYSVSFIASETCSVKLLLLLEL